jgi:hypothetical protein
VVVVVPEQLVATVLRTAAAVTVVLVNHRQLQVHQSRMPVVVQVARTRAVGRVRQRLVVLAVEAQAEPVEPQATEPAVHLA